MNQQDHPASACEDRPMRLANGSNVLGWGYEGRSPDDLVDDAQRWGVATVVDVRLNPISRKPGFSKRRLAERLDAAGLSYVHMPALGNPRDNREGFSDPSGEAGRAARQRFADDVLAQSEAAEAVAQLLTLSDSGSVLLLCYEAAERCCHRSLVLEAVRDRAVLMPV